MLSFSFPALLHLSVRINVTLQAEECGYVRYYMRNKQENTGFRDGAVSGRHVSFVLTHTQTCQTNNSSTPQLRATLNILPLGQAVSRESVCSLIFVNKGREIITAALKSPKNQLERVKTLD